MLQEDEVDGKDDEDLIVQRIVRYSMHLTLLNPGAFDDHVDQPICNKGSR